MSTVWVYKFDGTVQCADIPEVPKAEIRSQLAIRIGENNILSEAKEKQQLIVPQQCGLPTGHIYAFEITQQGWALLSTGFAGPGGFELLQEEVPGAKSSIIDISEFVGKLTSSQPVFVSQLAGHSLRVLPPGAFVSKDWRPDRCNIEVNEHSVITRVWFG